MKNNTVVGNELDNATVAPAVDTPKFEVLDNHIIGSRSFEIRKYSKDDSTKIFEVFADSTVKQISKDTYFELDSGLAEQQMHFSAVRRMLNSRNEGEETAPKFDWDNASNVDRHNYRCQVSDASGKVAEVLADMDSIMIQPYIDVEEDKVIPGGWLFSRPDGTIGFIEQYTRGSAKSLYIVLNEAGLMGQKGEFTKEEFISSKVRSLGDEFLLEQAGFNAIESIYQVDIERTPEDEKEIIMGTKTVEDFKTTVQVRQVFVFDTAYLVHIIMNDDDETFNKVYFVESLLKLNGSNGTVGSQDTVTAL